MAETIRRPHIQFDPLPEWQPDRRRRSANFPHPRPPAPDSRHDHGQEIVGRLNEVGSTIGSLAANSGIDPAKLQVLTFDTAVVDPTPILEERYGAKIVSQSKLRDPNGSAKFEVTAYFPGSTSLATLRDDIALYSSESNERGTLPPAQRRQFFDSILEVRDRSPDDRLGRRLSETGIPVLEPFYLDVDLWHPGDRVQAREQVEILRTFLADLGSQITDELITNSLVLVKIRASRLTVDHLKLLPVVAKVDLPVPLLPPYGELFTQDASAVPAFREPTPNDPIVTVIDSGVVAGHPILRNWIVDEIDFDTGTGSAVDDHGHGTALASLVIHGSVSMALESGDWNPSVRVCSAKVLRKHELSRKPEFPEENRIEAIFERAIRHFYNEHGCRVFSISVERPIDRLGSGPIRQDAWAQVLDELSRELDIVIVVLSGNASIPFPKDVYSRDQLPEQIRQCMLRGEEDNGITSPGCALNVVTVGSIARTSPSSPDIPGFRDAIPVVEAGAPSPFSRIGPGYPFSESTGSIKPDVVHYGGNAAVQNVAGGSPRWIDHAVLGELVARMDFSDGRVTTGMSGTSVAVPQVAHQAAHIMQSLERALDRKPSANLVRALLGCSCKYDPMAVEWFEREPDLIRVMGYGMPSLDSGLWSTSNSVTLIAEESVIDDKMVAFRIEIPNEFLLTRGQRSISVALAYDPPVRSTRRDYASRILKFDVVHGLTLEQIQAIRARTENGAESMSIPGRNMIEFRPPATAVGNSTLQVRRKVWRQRPRIQSDTQSAQPSIYILVTSTSRFQVQESASQNFGLAVNLWHEDDRIDLYQQVFQRIREGIRIRSERIRIT